VQYKPCFAWDPNIISSVCAKGTNILQEIGTWHPLCNLFNSTSFTGSMFSIFCVCNGMQLKNNFYDFILPVAWLAVAQNIHICNYELKSAIWYAEFQSVHLERKQFYSLIIFSLSLFILLAVIFRKTIIKLKSFFKRWKTLSSKRKCYCVLLRYINTNYPRLPTKL
jgi:hypothetical protein